MYLVKIAEPLNLERVLSRYCISRENDTIRFSVSSTNSIWKVSPVAEVLRIHEISNAVSTENRCVNVPVGTYVHLPLYDDTCKVMKNSKNLENINLYALCVFVRIHVSRYWFRIFREPRPPAILFVRSRWLKEWST
jgi:hypothetical protein